jgi:hypothetical protein
VSEEDEEELEAPALGSYQKREGSPEDAKEFVAWVCLIRLWKT